MEKNISVWNNHFKNFKDLIFHGKTFKDIEKANKEKKTAVKKLEPKASLRASTWNRLEHGNTESDATELIVPAAQPTR